MRSIILAVSITFISTNLVGNVTYDCIAKKGPRGYSVQDFEPFVLTTLGGHNISLLRKFILAGDEMFMDEQFWNIRPVECHIPGRGGIKFASLGMAEDSKNGYRIDPEIFSPKPPKVVSINYVLDKTGTGKNCVPAVYECIKRCRK
jgi:hypothetical protein